MLVSYVHIYTWIIMEHQNHKNSEPVQLTVYKRITRRRLYTVVIVIVALVAAAVGILLYRNYQDDTVKQTSSTQKTAFNNIQFDTTVEWNNDYRAS